jgi:FdhD protein
MKMNSSVWRYEEGVIHIVTDSVVTEYPVTIVLNGQEFATLVCSPDRIGRWLFGVRRYY